MNITEGTVGGHIVVNAVGPYNRGNTVAGRVGEITEVLREYFLCRFDAWSGGHGSNKNLWYIHPDDCELAVPVSRAETAYRQAFEEIAKEAKPEVKSLFPKAAAERKLIPICSGVLDYFPAAIAEVAKVSFQGNQQHNPGEELHWARGKSTDQSDTIIRHLMERGTLDTDGMRHSAKAAWRALALLQLELEAEGYPKARGAK